MIAMLQNGLDVRNVITVALDQMVENLVMGGRIALLGIPPGKSPVDWSRIVFKAITIKAFTAGKFSRPGTR